ncbi:MAG: hypothetical protein KBA66_10880 [Leptospiraceae bacterium]|nr:hypothetical protein [Leptospiraceae bacterium]
MNFCSLKRIIGILFILIVQTFLLNCASTQNYFINRASDLKDIFILGVEKDVYGFNIITLIPIVGVSHNSGGQGVGLRNSHLGFYKTGDKDNLLTLENITHQRKWSWYLGDSIFYSTGFHEPIHPSNLRTENKKFIGVNLGKGCTRGERRLYYKNESQLCHWYTGGKMLPIEFSLGLYIGVRVGFNFGEVVDFLGGVLGFDPLNDDISQVNIDLPAKSTINPNWESQFDSVDEIFNVPSKKDDKKKLSK